MDIIIIISNNPLFFQNYITRVNWSLGKSKRQTLQHQATQAGTSAAAASVVDTETLQSWKTRGVCQSEGHKIWLEAPQVSSHNLVVWLTKKVKTQFFKHAFRACAVVCELTDPVQHEVDNFLPDGVVSASKIVCCVFFSGNQLFRMEKLAISARSHFINHLSATHAPMAAIHQHFQVGTKKIQFDTICNFEHQPWHFTTIKFITILKNWVQSSVRRLQIHHHAARHVFSGTCLREEPWFPVNPFDKHDTKRARKKPQKKKIYIYIYSTCQNQNGVFAKLLVANTRHKRQRSVSYIGNTLWDVELVISVATSIPRSLQKNWLLGQLLPHCMRATCWKHHHRRR